MSKLRGMANTRKRAPARKGAGRTPAARRSTGGRARARPRSRRRRRARGFSWPALRMPLHLPELDQRQRDVIGLGLIAAGIFMGFVLWGSKGQPDPGGRVGHGLAVALGWAAGKARGLAPVALVGAGGALLLRPVWPSLRPLRAGAVCLFASITLALAAGALCVGPGVGASSRGTSWTSAFLQAHGGVAGEALYQAAHRLVQGVG